TATALPDPEALHGSEVFMTRCSVCHTVRGTSARGRLGPDLTHVMSRRMIASGMLINNTGTFIQGNVSDEPDGALETMLNVNLFSAYHTTRAFLPYMKRQGSGHIFNTSSIAGISAYPGGGSYSISKFALMGFTKNLRQELKDHGIKVTAILPGAVYTDSWKGSGVSEDRIMEAEDIAKLVYNAATLSPQATVEEILVRPQLGDL
ncbi:MAG: SDR family NAD(P)-dependent oxidoreductase, partial [Chitinophagaceae bacterium]